MDMVWERFQQVPASQLTELATNAPADSSLRVKLEGESLEGKQIHKTVLLPLGNEGTAEQRIAHAGVTLEMLGDAPEVMAVKLKGPAQKAGFEQGFKIVGLDVEAPRPVKEWLYFPGFLLIAAVFFWQRRRPEDIVAPPVLRGT